MEIITRHTPIKGETFLTIKPDGRVTFSSEAVQSLAISAGDMVIFGVDKEFAWVRKASKYDPFPGFPVRKSGNALVCSSKATFQRFVEYLDLDDDIPQRLLFTGEEKGGWKQMRKG